MLLNSMHKLREEVDNICRDQNLIESKIQMPHLIDKKTLKQSKNAARNAVLSTLTDKK